MQRNTQFGVDDPSAIDRDFAAFATPSADCAVIDASGVPQFGDAAGNLNDLVKRHTVGSIFVDMPNVKADRQKLDREWLKSARSN